MATNFAVLWVLLGISIALLLADGIIISVIGIQMSMNKKKTLGFTKSPKPYDTKRIRFNTEDIDLLKEALVL